MIRNTRRLLLRVSGRMTIAAVLLLALAPPPMFASRTSLDLIVLVDESLSVPRSFTDAAWQQIGALLNDAPADTKMQLIRFAATAVPETVVMNRASGIPRRIPRSGELDTTATNIAAALEQALFLRTADRPTSLLLLSDGAATHGDTASALESVHGAGIPLYLLSPPAGSVAGPVKVTDLLVPIQVGLGERVPVRVLLSSLSAATVDLIMEVDGRVVGRQSMNLTAGQPSAASFHFIANETGVKRVTVRVAADLEHPAVAHAALTTAVTVLGPAPVLYVSSTGNVAPLAASLDLGAWEVLQVSPAGLTANRTALRQAGTIILDNLAVADMSELTWQAVANSVTRDGKGLLVLGGENSFGAGAYRHSTLEQILPVTAESAQPQAPAAVLFLLDTSGSMGRVEAGPSRFARARQGVLAARERLLPGDETGIIAFASDARVILPLARWQNDDDSFTRALDLAPGGGTQLAPALELALEQLSVTASEKRLIILVTDGFAGSEGSREIIRKLRDLGVTVIALAVGADADLKTLGHLTDFNNGRVLPVTAVSSLSGIMSEAVAKQRAPTVAKSTQPVQRQRLPYMSASLSWPTLEGYMVSKARPDATVYLESERGDPLIATGLAGAGRVAVLPAGLGNWAGRWWQWPGIGEFTGGLLGWLGQGRIDPGFSISVKDNPGALEFTVDIRANNVWVSTAEPTLLLDDPSGGRTNRVLTLTGPGRYEAVLPAAHAGLYQATLHYGEHTGKAAIFRNITREFRDPTGQQERLGRWLERGWVRAWPGIDAFKEAWPREGSGRGALLLLALLSYFLLLCWERGLAATLVKRCFSGFAR